MMQPEDCAKLLLGVPLEEISWLVDSKTWEESPELALSLAMRRSGRYDTKKYLVDNPDVACAGVSAEEHYVRYGFWEGRKMSLVLRDDGCRESALKDCTTAKHDETDVLRKQVARLEAENSMLHNWLQTRAREMEQNNND